MHLSSEPFIVTSSPKETHLRRVTLAAMSSSRPWSSWAYECPPANDWLAFAERNRVDPLVAHVLMEHAATEAERSQAKALHDRSASRMQALLGSLDLVADKLATAGIPMIALKNAGIARGIFPCAACCPMGDIDTLVPKDRFREAHELVLAAGFTFASRAPEIEPAELEHGLFSGGTEYVLQVGEHEVWLELQWRAVSGRWIRKDQEPNSDELFARSVAIPGSNVRLLSPEDNMMQVCLHTAKHTYVRAPGLRLHTDVDRLHRFAPPDWTVFLERAKSLEVETAVYFSLAMARALLNTEIPDEVLTEVTPASWKRKAVATWLKKIDVFEPDSRKFSRPGMMVFHGLLYDSAKGLLASALDTDPSHLGLRDLPSNLRAGAKRIKDLATRYQA